MDFNVFFLLTPCESFAVDLFPDFPPVCVFHFPHRINKARGPSLRVFSMLSGFLFSFLYTPYSPSTLHHFWVFSPARAQTGTHITNSLLICFFQLPPHTRRISCFSFHMHPHTHVSVPLENHYLLCEFCLTFPRDFCPPKPAFRGGAVFIAKNLMFLNGFFSCPFFRRVGPFYSNCFFF